jgi:arylsulfatase
VPLKVIRGNTKRWEEFLRIQKTILEVQMQKSWIAISLSFLVGAITATSVSAQQITGTPGSPSATTTITGKQLPPPDPKFGGVIKERASESTP